MGASLGVLCGSEGYRREDVSTGGLRGWPVVKVLGFWRGSAFKVKHSVGKVTIPSKQKNRKYSLSGILVLLMSV